MYILYTNGKIYLFFLVLFLVFILCVPWNRDIDSRFSDIKCARFVSGEGWSRSQVLVPSTFIYIVGPIA